MSFIKRLAACALGLAFPYGVHAADAARPAPYTIVVEALNKVEANMWAFTENAQIHDIGMSILVTLGTITFLWALVKGMGTGRFIDQVFGDLVPLALGVCLALLLMGNFPQVPNVAKSIQTFMTAIAQPFLPAGFGSSPNLGDIVASAIGMSFETIVNIFTIPMAKRAGVDIPLLGGIVDVLNFMDMVMVFLLKLIVTLGAGFLVLVAVGLFVGSVFVTQVAYIIAVAFLPIFVAFIVFKPLQHLFQNWLSFTVTAMFTKVVALMMLNVSKLLFDTMGDIANSAASTAIGYNSDEALTLDVNNLLLIFLFSAISVIMMSQAKTIASGIIGSISVGFEGWSSLIRSPVSQGVMGGVGKPEMAKGGGSNGVGNGQTNALSAATAAAPNFMKPMMRPVGDVMSSIAGRAAAGRAYAAEKAATGSDQKASKVYADMKGMSSEKAQSFQKAMDTLNTARANNGMDPVEVAHPRSQFATMAQQVRDRNATSSASGPTESIKDIREAGGNSAGSTGLPNPKREASMDNWHPDKGGNGSVISVGGNGQVSAVTPVPQNQRPEHGST